MKIALIYAEQKTGTGAHYINTLIAKKLREKNVKVTSFYPKFPLAETPIHFEGIKNILFFYSLLEKRDEILSHDIIQGTTYTPLAFLRHSKPVVSHFGSTTVGFLRAVPKIRSSEKKSTNVFPRLKKAGVINEHHLKTRRPLNDIASIERYAAEQADYIVATSDIVKKDLLALGIPNKKITIVHNAIEDYWFETPSTKPNNKPSIVFLGRIGDDTFTLKLKGIDRLIWLFEQFPKVEKISIMMSRNKKLVQWMTDNIPNHSVILNMIKKDIPALLGQHAGSIALITSRYEGFSLSLVEAMSQGLVPITFPVGIAPEIIINGENGFIVHTIEEAEEKISFLLENNTLRHTLAVNAKTTAKQFNADAMIEKTLALYKKILRETGKTSK